MTPPLVSMVIVNYNAGDFLRRCLLSIQAQTYAAVEVIIVDNASRDGSLATLPPGIDLHLVRNAHNNGYARAQNQGLRLAGGRYQMPLNFDMLLPPDFLDQAVAALEGAPAAGSLAPRLLRMSAGGEPLTKIDNAGLLLSPRRTVVHRGRGEHDQGQWSSPAWVFAALGAAVLYRRAALADVQTGGQFFDESFFTWYEDIDLEWRLRRRGWECLYAPQACAYHAGDPHGHGQTAFAAQHGIRNRWWMILANDCPHCLHRDLPHLWAEELALLRHVLTHRRLAAYLRALGETLARLPAVLHKRQAVTHLSRRSCLPAYPLPL